ncbi:hypothetical protein [Nocardia arizonensis]|uniref:hypothetical protein n=1 Tax=Nocardia arizonensis TaxID=1141647 RepID=UPI000A4F7AA6|nr:hypothetical protein [Nocardia arizonensis]
MEQAFKYDLLCSNCGQPAAGWQGQELPEASNAIRWFIEWCCLSCGLVSDDYGNGPGPESLRRALIERFGGSTIAVANRDTRLAILKKLREIFGFTLSEALTALTGSGPDNPLGTTIEVQAIIREIEKQGRPFQRVDTTVAPGGLPDPN